MNLIDDKSDSIVICEGEFDAMAVYQQTSYKYIYNQKLHLFLYQMGQIIYLNN